MKRLYWLRHRLLRWLDDLTRACMDNEMFYAAVILFCVCGTLAMIGR